MEHLTKIQAVATSQQAGQNHNEPQFFFFNDTATTEIYTLPLHDALPILPDFALDPDASAVDLYKVLGDGQPEAGTADLTRTRGVDAIKTFENARLIGLRDADAGIGDGEDDFAVVGLRADPDLSARQRVLGRVIQQILQNLGQKAAVAGDFRQIFGDIDGNANVFFRCTMLRSFQAALDELRNADGA